jgi:hypothetical protein
MLPRWLRIASLVSFFRQLFHREHAIKGVLSTYSDQGTEGFLWTLEEQPLRGYEGLHFLENGDHLTVFAEDGSVIWAGVIDLEFETGYQPFEDRSGYGQQIVFGRYVNGNQRGMDLEDWASMFFTGNYKHCRYRKPLRGVLRLREKQLNI